MCGCNHFPPTPLSEYGNLPPLSITLNGPEFHTAYANDTLFYQANVSQVHGVPVLDGTPFQWLTSGHGHWLKQFDTTVGGIVTNRYVLGEGVSVDLFHLIAGVDSDSVVYFAPLTLELNYPKRLILAPHTISTLSGSVDTLTGIVLDTNFHSVSNVPLTLGSTDSTGLVTNLGFSPSGDTIRLQLTAGHVPGSYKLWGTTQNGVSDTTRFTVIVTSADYIKR